MAEQHQEPGGADDAAAAFPIVGVGASAGGLESLEQLFRKLPDRTGMAFVVVQHLSPDFKSMMDELLARYTGLTVELAEDGVAVEPDHVYLLPSRKEIELEDGRLRLHDKGGGAHLSFPIDRFLASLARDAGRRAIAVILSGSGSDGSRGIRAVSEAGGIVVVESPSSARFDGMPTAAIDTGLADLVLAPDQIAGALLDHGEAQGDGDDDAPGDLEAALRLLRRDHGLDFADYKRTTVLRRLRRRVALTGAPGLGGYVERLADDPDERRALYHDLLIGVTAFFRDPSCWDVLAREACGRLVEEAAARELRVWVAGCATGEEAYTMAIAFHEAFRRADRPVRMRVFATDVHRPSLDVAGAGVYPADRLDRVPAELLERYFRRVADDAFQVTQELRHTVVFAPHNLLRDAPFTHLDLVSCRNLLIYLRPAAQRRALGLLHYGLRLGGFLLLGSSESPGELAADYDVVDEGRRLYTKRQVGRHPLDLGLTGRGRDRGADPGAPRSRTAESALIGLYDALLDRFMPQGFLVDDQHALIDSFGGAQALLRVPPRRPARTLLEMVPDGVRATLAGALHRVARTSARVQFAGLRWPGREDAGRFTLAVEPVRPARGRTASYVITLEPSDPAPGGPGEPALDLDDRGAVAAMSSERIIDLERELHDTKESLQATIEEVETSNEELQATNEELVASNEELQSTNEELHSVNEELHTVNAEYQRKIEELQELNRDIRHLLESSDVATVFLDHELRIRKFTPRAADIFSLVDHDLGRRLTRFRHGLRGLDLDAALHQVCAERVRVEAEVRDDHGRTLFVRLAPYDVDGEVRGVVVAMIDVSTLAEQRARTAHLSSIVASSSDAIVGVDLDGRITSWNEAAVALYGRSPGEAIGAPIAILAPPDRQAEIAQLLARALGGERIVNHETVRVHQDGTRREVSTSMAALRDDQGHVCGVAAIDRDIGERLAIERRLRDSERKYEDLYNHAPDMYISVEARSAQLTECNETFCAATGMRRADAVGRHVLELFAATSRPDALAWWEAVTAGDAPVGVELDLLRADDGVIPVSLSASAIVDAGGHVAGVRLVLRDVSHRRAADRAMQEAVRLREGFLAMMSHELRNPVHAIRAATQLLTDDRAAAGQRETALRVVARQAEHMGRLLDDLLDVARITERKLELHRGRIDVGAILRDAVDASAPAFAERGVLLGSTIDGPLPGYGDRTRLHQVFSNLLSNALKHSSGGQRVDVTAARDGARARVRVRDHGEGIDPPDLQRIFELFVQGEQGIDRAAGGLGIGLSIARSIVEAHGGSIVARSGGRGAGAELEVALPLDDAAVTEGADGATARRRIVLVEDQEDARQVIQLVLELEGHEVFAAADGHEAVRLIETHRPQVALVDLGLPVLDGFEVARRVRARGLTDTVLVALTGYGQPGDVERARAAGFDRHLTKPVAASTLKEIVAGV